MNILEYIKGFPWKLALAVFLGLGLTVSVLARGPVKVIDYLVVAVFAVFITGVIDLIARRANK